MTLLAIVLLPFLGALLPGPVARLGRIWSAWAAGAVTLAALALLLSLAPRVFAGEVVLASWPWIPSAGLNLTFMLDGFGFLFALLILGIGFLIVLYARYYLHEHDPMGRFYGFLMLFMGSMLGVVLSGNILLLVVFWELTSLSSFLLIGYWKHRADARQGARQALAITGGGGLALIAGMLLLGEAAGSYELPAVLAAGDAVRASPLYLPILALVLLGAFTKSAQFPFHFWLPDAMAAPTPVSAYLHSATMVKAGVFLLGRLFPVLAGTDAWLFAVGGTGLVTMVFAAYVALFKDDLKGLLAYSTVSHLGLITMLFGFGVAPAAVAGVFHIINHATFKASLFMAAGIVDHEAGTRDMRRLGGLARAMPHTAALAMIAAAAMAGVPLFNGFLSKEMMFAEALHIGRLGGAGSWVVPLLATVGAVFSVAYSARFIHDVFLGPMARDLPKSPHEPPRWMKVPVEILAVLCLGVGIFPALVAGDLLAASAGAVVGGNLPDYSLAIWHGFNLPLLMSAIALGGGIMLFLGRGHLVRLHDRMPTITGRAIFAAIVECSVVGARRFTRGLHNGSLQRYLAVLVAATLVIGLAAFQGAALGPGSRPMLPVDAISVAAWLLLVVASIGTAVLHRRRFVAIVVIGLVGLVVALTFVHFSAPDLALTQISVEIVTIVLLLLALNLLPKEGPRDSAAWRRGRDVVLAVLSGGGVAALAWAAMTRPLDSISWFHLEQSVPGGGGANVVNVILVDFRGFDTLGEIIVLAIAALGIYAMVDNLLKGPAGRRMGGTAPGWAPAADRHPLILAVATRLLLPLALMVAVYLLLRGHNQPGGGFIAGLVTAVALIMQYMANGIVWTQERLRLDYHPVIALGVLVAGLTGVASWLFGAPYLTSTYGHVHWPVVGDFELASAMAFDLGVFLTVVGACMLVLANMARIETGARRPETVLEPEEA